MAYSTFIRGESGLSKFTKLEVLLCCASGKDGVYLINLDNHPEVDGHRTVDMGDSLDIIVVGDRKTAEDFANLCGKPYGLVKYNGQTAARIHYDAVLARKLIDLKNKSNQL